MSLWWWQNVAPALLPLDELREVAFQIRKACRPYTWSSRDSRLRRLGMTRQDRVSISATTRADADGAGTGQAQAYECIYCRSWYAEPAREFHRARCERRRAANQATPKGEDGKGKENDR